MCTEKRTACGFTLPELLLLIVVFAIGLAGILAVINNAVMHSADPMARKQAMAVAESMMEEILLQSGFPQANAPGRQNFNDVLDYNGFATAGVVGIDGVPVPGLGNYNVGVTVVPANLNGVGAFQVTVTVNYGAQNFVLDGYKFAYN